MEKKQILYEDNNIIVCHKPAGIATQTARIAERDMVSEISNYLAVTAKEKTPPYVGVVHRLDQPVEGILVFAKTRKAAGALSSQIAKNKMRKYYYAVVAENCSPEDINAMQSGTLTDYLYHDGKTNMTSVVSKEHKDAKRAELFYEIKKRDSEKKIALAEIKLVTGRHHQIRVQMSHAGMELLGDSKYAGEKTRQLSEEMGQRQIALCAYKLVFDHPVTGKRMTFQKEPEGEIFHRFL